MKAATISKIASFIIAISVLVVFSIPVYAGLHSFQTDGTNFIEIESEYDLSYMTESTLKSNIKAVVGENDGYKIVYGNEIDSVKIDRLDELVYKIKNSDSTSATLLKPNGDIATQQTIIGSKDTYQYIFAGLKLSNSLVKIVSPSVEINASTGDSIYKISDVEVIKSDDSYIVAIELPMIVVASALALNADINLNVGIEYRAFFDVNIQMYLPPETFVPSDIAYVVSPDGKCIVIDVDLGAIGDINATVGDVCIKVTDHGNITISSTELNIVDSLKEALDDQGNLIINIEGEESIVIDHDDAITLIDLLNQLITSGVLHE